MFILGIVENDIPYFIFLWGLKLQCESGFIEIPLSEINLLISLVWAEGGKDVGDPMLKIEKYCESRSAHVSENRK